MRDSSRKMICQPNSVCTGALVYATSASKATASENGLTMVGSEPSQVTPAGPDGPVEFVLASSAKSAPSSSFVMRAIAAPCVSTRMCLALNCRGGASSAYLCIRRGMLGHIVGHHCLSQRTTRLQFDLRLHPGSACKFCRSWLGREQIDIDQFKMAKTIVASGRRNRGAMKRIGSSIQEPLVIRIFDMRFTTMSPTVQWH